MKATGFILQFGFGIKDVKIIRSIEDQDRHWTAFQSDNYIGHGRTIEECLAMVRASLHKVHDEKIAAAIKVLGEMEATRAKIDAETELPKEGA